MRRLASWLEPAREPLTSRAEPTFPARKMTEPSLARLANPPSHTEPSRLGSFLALATARAKGGTGASERAEGIIPNVEVVTEKAQSGRIFCEEPSTEKTVCYRCSANKAHGLCFGPDGCICRAHLEGLTFASSSFGRVLV